MSIAGLIVLAVLANEIGAANWPQFRSPTGLNYTDEKNLPLTWNAKTASFIGFDKKRARSSEMGNVRKSPLRFDDDQADFLV